MARPDVVSFAALLVAEDCKLFDLDDDALRVIHAGLSDPLNPGIGGRFRSLCKGLSEPTRELVKDMRDEHDAAAKLCLKLGMSCRVLRESKMVFLEAKSQWVGKHLSAADLALLGGLGRSLPQLGLLFLGKGTLDVVGAAGHDGAARLVAGLVAGALPKLTDFQILEMPLGNTGASALAAALGRGALPRLKCLALDTVNISDAGLVALAPALRRLPALDQLYLKGNPIGDEGLAALVPQLPTGDLLPPTGKLAKLAVLDLESTQLSDAGCAALAAAITSGALPLLDDLELGPGGIPGIPASAAAIGAVHAALRDYDSQRRFESMYL